MAGSLAVLAAGLLYQRRLRNRRREASERFEQFARERAAAGASKQEARRRMAEESIEGLESVAAFEVESVYVDAGPELSRVEDVIRKYPPALPRGAKRMLNHARLLTRIATERGMFGGEPELAPEHLGEWIVLLERWPSVARSSLGNEISCVTRNRRRAEEVG